MVVSRMRVQPPPERADVMLVSHERHVMMALKHLIGKTHNDLKVFGLDCEWDLVTRKGVVHKPDILQIGTVNGFCAIFRLHYLNTIPYELRGFLEDPYFLKVGVGVVEDSDKLKQSYDVSVAGVVDVRHVADELDIAPKGLSQLTDSVLGTNLTKYHHSFHQWTGRLSHVQLQYAALDAVYSARVFYKLSHDRLYQDYGEGWKDWDHKKYHETTLSMWQKYFSKGFEFGRCNFYRKHVIDTMLTFCDLSLDPEMVSEHQEAQLKALKEKEDAASLALLKDATEDSEDDDDVPKFKAKFSKKKKKTKGPKKIPMRYLKKALRNMEAKGMDPRTVPSILFPACVLNEEGKLDMEKIKDIYPSVKT